MGRELRRVPLDFDHPIHERWPGYLNEFYTATNCETCEGNGLSPIGKQLHDAWYGHAPFKPEDRGSKPFPIDHPYVRAFAERNVDSAPDFYGTQRIRKIWTPVYRKYRWGWEWDEEPQQIELSDEEYDVVREAAVVKEAQRLCDQCWNNHWSHHLNQMDVDALVDRGRLREFTHVYTPDTRIATTPLMRWQLKDPPYHPTAEEVNAWSLQGFGHDGGNQYIIANAFLDRHGLDGLCSHCKGEGHLWSSPEEEALYEAWSRTDPPVGEGYQMWETTTEGSPISPVFKTPEELARYLVSGVRDKTIDKDTSYEQWMAFILGDGWAPTMIIENGVMKTGVEAGYEPSTLTDQST